MGFLTQLLGQDRSPTADYWYMPIGASTKAGVPINDETALRISAVLQGIRFLCQTTAQLPRFIFQHRDDGQGRDKDTQHPLNRIIRFQPNAWQTSFQFIELLTAHALMRGIGVAERVDNEAGQLVALIPQSPDSLERITQRDDGRLRYHYRRNDGSPKVLLQEQVLSVSGFGVDGVKGLALVQQMRETAGLSVATENYGASFFSNSAMPRVVLSSPHAVKGDTRTRMKDDWNRAYGGDRHHGTALLEEGTKVDVLSTKNDEAQFIETRKFLIAEFSRHLDVTPHRLSDLEKSSFNNVEQMSLETVIYSLTPWVKRWEQSMYRDLLTEEDKNAGYFVEFNLDGLLRGDTEARTKLYQSGIMAGWLTRNEVRQLENLNPLPGLDTPLQAVNQAPVTEDEGAEDDSAETATPPPEAQEDRAAALAQSAAARVLRREKLEVKKRRASANGDAESFKQGLEGFYSSEEFIGFVSDTLAISIARARQWCQTRCRAATEQGEFAGELGLLYMEALA